MDSASIALILATLGVNFGWQPTSEGPAGYEYTVQIEPEIADLLRRGESVPIESNVPADVAPIRKVKIVVGRGDVPRTALAADSARSRAATAPDQTKLIVRGQSPDGARSAGSSSRNHTSAFAGETSPWAPERINQPANNPNVDRYGNPINRSASGVAPPPGFGGRVGGAVDDTAGALRDGLEAGFAEANEQLTRAGDDLWEGTRSATQNVAQQLQATGGNLRGATEQTLNAVGNQAQQAGRSLGLTGSQPPPFVNPNAVSSSAPSQPTSSSAPPWLQAPAPSRSVSVAGGPLTRTAKGWTSIGNNIAAPPVLPPGLVAAGANSGIANNTNARPAASNAGGPIFPSGQATSRDPLHSPLRDPWDNRLGTGQTATSPSSAVPRQGNSGSDPGLFPVRPVTPRVPEQQQTTGGFSDPWDADPWKQPPQALPVAGAASNTAPMPSPQGGNIQSGNWSNDGALSGAANWSDGANGSLAGNTGSAATNNNASPPGGVTSSALQTLPVAAGSNAPATTTAAATPALAGTNPASVPGTEVPWRPLLFVSLGLVCSLSANLFLGWSYMDARQRYVALVRKTAQSFRRRATEAAA